MDNRETEFNELSFYTLAHPDASFIHQHIVDAYTAQTANEHTKSIALTFSLAGLYLYLEKNFTGKQVQLFHMYMSKNKRKWPAFILPETRGKITVSEVLATSPGPQRDNMIRKWCKNVWEAYRENRQIVIDLLDQY